MTKTQQNEIPRQVHYCWYGRKPLTGIVKRCVKTFKIVGGGGIYEWNETNCPFDETQYVIEAARNHGYAYLSDYYRLKALYEQGGVYLDTDIEVRKPFADMFFKADLVLGYMFDDMVSTACIMAKPGHPFIKRLLDKYETMAFSPDYANNHLMTETLLEAYPGFKLNGKYCEFDKNCFIYPKEWFEAPILRGEGGYAVHHFTGFWKRQSNPARRLARTLLKQVLFRCHFLNVIYNHYGRKKALGKNSFYQRYLQDKQ